MAGRALSAFLIAAALAISPPARAFDPASTGVVVMHGKWGHPGDPNTTGGFAAALKSAGFMVDQPEMPWSGARLYDRSFDQAMDEIDVAVARLRAGGAKKIVIAGHSLGGSAALHYAALGRPVDAVILIAPAPMLEGKFYREREAGDVAKAQDMVAAGHGEDTAQFTDLNSGDRSRSVRFKAAIYLSYNGPDGPAAMGSNVRHLGPAPVLWIAPKFDPVTAGVDRIVWPKVPSSTPATRIDVISDHIGAAMAGRDAAIDWLRKLN